jgi:hypothetical protein
MSFGTIKRHLFQTMRSAIDTYIGIKPLWKDSE